MATVLPFVHRSLADLEIIRMQLSLASDNEKMTKHMSHLLPRVITANILQSFELNWCHQILKLQIIKSKVSTTKKKDNEVFFRYYRHSSMQLSS